MRCIPKGVASTQTLLNYITNNVPNAQKNIKIDDVSQGGSLPVAAESPCSIDGDGRPNANVTQRVAFATSDELKKFINSAFATPTPTPGP
jgi:hypothetical protein